MKPKPARIGMSAALFLAGAAVFAAQPKPAPPSITLQANGVLVSGLTPGGSLTLCSEANEPQRYSNQFIHRDAFITDKARTGQIRIPLDSVSETSIWFAVDNATGAYSVVAPAQSKYQAIEVPPNALRRNGKGELFKIDMPLAIFDLLLVRPGAGSWSGTIGDGGKLDDDPRPNGRAAADIAKLAPLGGSGPPPEKLRKGDVLIGIDPMSLRYFALVVGEE